MAENIIKDIYDPKKDTARYFGAYAFTFLDRLKRSGKKEEQIINSALIAFSAMVDENSISFPITINENTFDFSIQYGNKKIKPLKKQFMVPKPPNDILEFPDSVYEEALKFKSAEQIETLGKFLRDLYFARFTHVYLPYAFLLMIGIYKVLVQALSKNDKSITLEVKKPFYFGKTLPDFTISAKVK